MDLLTFPRQMKHRKISANVDDESLTLPANVDVAPWQDTKSTALWFPTFSLSEASKETGSLTSTDGPVAFVRSTMSWSSVAWEISCSCSFWGRNTCCDTAEVAGWCTGVDPTKKSLCKCAWNSTWDFKLHEAIRTRENNSGQATQSVPNQELGKFSIK